MSRKMLIRVPTVVILFVFLATFAWAAEWVDFEGKSPLGEKIQLRGILNKPKGDGPFPAVVMLCGCEGLQSKDDSKNQKAWAKRLMSWGYVTLSVDSFTPRNFESVCENGSLVNDNMRSSDAFSAKSYLTNLTYVDPENIGVIGWSHGGWAVMKIIDTMWRDKNYKPFQVAVTFYPWCSQFSIPDTPLLILIGEEDNGCPASRCENLQKSRVVKESDYEFKLILYPHTHHAFDIKGINKDVYDMHVEYNPEATADAIVQTKEFLAKYLKAK
jgi:dienelactone hydrolase